MLKFNEMKYSKQITSLNIYKEISNAKPIIKIALEAESKYEGDFLSAAIDNREELINFIKETNILETFMPAVLEILEASDSLEGVDIEELKKIDFSTDKAYIADMLSVLFDFIEETELDFENPEALLGNENLPTALKGFGEALKDTTFLDLLLGVLQNALDDALVSAEGLESLTEILDVTKIERENLSSDLYQLGVIANAIYNSGILEEADLLSKPEELKKLINAVLDFSLVKGNEAEIIDTLLETANLKEALVELGVEINYENIDWNTEKVKLGNIIDAIADANKNIENFNFENVTQDVLSNDKNKEKHLVIFFDDSENIPNRILSEFSCYRKECTRWGDGTYRMLLYYNKDDSKEIVIRLLGYGSLITVDEDSGDVLKEMKERLENQLVLSKMVKKNKDNVIEDVESEYEI